MDVRESLMAASQQNILLLTATIQPKPQPQLVVADTRQRLDDYERALAHYAALLQNGVIDHIVFVENSGFDLHALARKYPSTGFEWISVYDLDYPTNYHRGYGEFRLVDHAFDASMKLKGMRRGDVVWKITGRYIVKNLRNVLRFAPKDVDLYCEARNGWVEMSVMAWSRRGYELVIKAIWERFATDKAPELILADVLNERQMGPLRAIRRYYWPPFIVGRRATDGSSFQGRLSRLRFALSLFSGLASWPFRDFPMQAR